MARLSKEERERMEAALREDDEADDDDEYELGFADGSYVRGRHSRVSKVAAARGVKIEPDPDADPKDGGGKNDPKGGGQGGSGDVRRFGRRVS